VRETLAFAALMPWLVFAFGAAAEPSRYSKALQQACAADYKKYCGEYGIETAALRTCMDKNGHSLTKTCVRALIDAGEVSQAEVDRRKKSGR
jgi:hypothetical protein